MLEARLTARVFLLCAALTEVAATRLAWVEGVEGVERVQGVEDTEAAETPPESAQVGDAPVPVGVMPGDTAVPAGTPEPPLKDHGLDPLLARLARELSQPEFVATLAADAPFPVFALSEPLRSALDVGLLRIDTQGRVQVYVYFDNSVEASSRLVPSPTLARLESLGCRIETVDPVRGVAQATVPAGSLVAVASQPGVRRLGVPRHAVVDTGPTTTEGDALLRAQQTRALYGVDGTGVKVGVISDGIYQIQSAVTSGDLPPTSLVYQGGKLVGTGGGVISTSFRADRDLEAGLGGGRGAEGVALLEIVHDLAPAAQLYFANFSTDLEFNNAVSYLTGICDVLVDDVSFLGGPYDGTSGISTHAAAALNDPSHPIRAFFTSAGNRALDHYEEPYVASSLDGLGSVGASGRFHQFGPTGGTSDALGLGPRPQNSIFLFKNQTAIIVLSWNDPQDASTNDYDLYLLRSAGGTLVASSTGPQNGSQDPLEHLSYTNTGSSGYFDLRVHNYLDSAEPRSLEIFVLERPFRTTFTSTGATLSYNTPAGSIPMLADAGGGVVSVGAIDAADPDNDTIEPFSSRGPTNDGRLKPDIASVDGVMVSGAGGFPRRFYGTSAAAPHAAGVAALLLQMAPCLMGPPLDPDAGAERAELLRRIQNHAIDLGGAGPDQTYGHGRNDALSAAEPMLPSADPGPAVVTAECSGPEGAMVTLDASASRALLPTCDLSFRWSGPFGTLDGVTTVVTLPLGQHGVTLEVSQNGGVTSALSGQTVVVSDTVAPVLSADPTPALLWPPDHRLETIATGLAAIDACDPAPSLALSAALSSEPDDAIGVGDGETIGDIQGADLGSADTSVILRAERAGGGTGRIYGLSYAAADASGNASSMAIHVRVPHSMSPSVPEAGLAPDPMLLEFVDSVSLRWDTVPGARLYQIVRGRLGPSSPAAVSDAVNLGPAVCLGTGAASWAADPSSPPAGGVYYYLGRYHDGTGFGAFGAATSGADRLVSITGCP